MPEDLLAQARGWRGLEGVRWYSKYWCLRWNHTSFEEHPKAPGNTGLELGSRWLVLEGPRVPAYCCWCLCRTQMA